MGTNLRGDVYCLRVICGREVVVITIKHLLGMKSVQKILKMTLSHVVR